MKKINISNIILKAHRMEMCAEIKLTHPKMRDTEIFIIKDSSFPYSYNFLVRVISFFENEEGNKIDKIMFEERVTSDTQFVEVLESLGFKGFGFFRRDYFMSR